MFFMSGNIFHTIAFQKIQDFYKKIHFFQYEIFGGWFHPFKKNFYRKKNTYRFVFRVLQHIYQVV